jgi:hypothetical protein
MKIILTTLALLAMGTIAYASCRSHTYYANGRVVTCTICCDRHGNCMETCND